MISVAQAGIPGWFDFPDVYQRMVREAKDGDRFVEVGVYCGASACFMGEQIRESRKAIRFFGVDPFENQGGFLPNSPENNCIVARGGVLPTLRHFLRETGTDDYVHVLPFTSRIASRLFEKGSLAFVFIDGNHDYPFVHDDLLDWFDLVREGGWIGGHDYTQYFPGVPQAVDEFFRVPSMSLAVPPSSWLIRKGAA